MKISTAEYQRRFEQKDLSADLVVAGGGLTGVCAAIAAARAGLKVVLVQDRPVLGGNASSEVRLWALGATSHMGNNNRWSREGGIIDEILVENVYRNREGNPVLFDMVLIDKVVAEKNITLLLNTTLYSVSKKDGRLLESVVAVNPQNGTEYHIEGKLFADCTGDGTLGYLAGASYRMGAEEASEYGEGFAPDKGKYGELLGHSILFYVKDTGKPVKFTAPDFALKNAEKLIPKLQNPHYFNVNQHGCKYWWLEYGGRLDTVRDTEEIKFELWKVVYGVWDYIKNSGKFPQAENYTLEWAGLFPGKRESRRFNGLYTINQKDVIAQNSHYDAVAYGGWAIDLHPSDGVYADGNACNQWHSKGVYQIPYRCYVSRDIDNLFIAGRIMSSSHVANGTTRVMCTAALGGEAVGNAAAICLSDNISPAELSSAGKVSELQSVLIENGNFIPGLCEKAGTDLVSAADLEVSSSLELDSLPADGSMAVLECSAAQLIPVCRKVPVISTAVFAAEAGELRVELRSSVKSGNYTPDRVDAVRTVQLHKGENRITLDFDCEYESARYVFVCFMANGNVRIPLSGHLVTGLTCVHNQINPAVSNFGCQTPPDGIGVESFEFWCPKRRPEGRNIAMDFSPALGCFGAENLKNNYFRPYLSPNAWVAAPDDETPSIKLKWKEKRKVCTISLFFDTDADHAMETVQMGHSEAVMPCVYNEYMVYDADGRQLFHVKDNHNSRNTLILEKPLVTDSIIIKFARPEGKVYPGLMGIIVK